jgi:hypothetical protein
VILTLLLPLLTGCTEGPECSEEEACPFGSVCVEGVCETRSCATSAQCEMEQYCAEGVCNDGCAEDSDCYPGEGCDVEAASCEAIACSDQHRDCGYKEFCNTVTGDCFEASGYYCQPCAGDADCGGGDNFCYQDYCVVPCDTSEDCPSSFTCIPWVDNSYNIQYYGCYTYCWLFEDNDYSDGLEDSAGARPLPEVMELPTCLQVDERGEAPDEASGEASGEARAVAP